MRREDAPPPVATTLVALTPRGEALRAAVEALGRWGGALLGEPRPGDAFQTRWLALPIGLHLKDWHPRRPPIAIEIRTGDEPLVVDVANGRVTTRLGPAGAPMRS